MRLFWAALILFGLVFFWMVIYYAQQESKRLDVTDYTNKAFYEPVVNLGVVACLFAIYDIVT